MEEQMNYSANTTCFFLFFFLLSKSLLRIWLQTSPSICVSIYQHLDIDSRWQQQLLRRYTELVNECKWPIKKQQVGVQSHMVGVQQVSHHFPPINPHFSALPSNCERSVSSRAKRRRATVVAWCDGFWKKVPRRWTWNGEIWPSWPSNIMLAA